MSRKYWPVVVLVVAILFAATTHAQSDKKTASTAESNQAPSSAAAQANATDDSKEGVILEHMITRWSFEKDGTGTREINAVIRVQAQAGVQSLAVLSFAYTSDDETVDVDYVRVRKPDGSVVVTPAYNIQDLPAEISRQAPMYSDIHEKQVTVKGLSVGDVLEYLVRYRTLKPEIPGQFWMQDDFVKDLVARDEELEVSVPADKYVNVSSPELKPEITEQAGRRIYRWKRSNPKRRDPELLPKRELPPPSVELTTFRNWDELGQWYGGLQRSRSEVTPEIRAKAEEVTKGLTTDDEKIHALYSFVATQFHYVSISFGIGRFQPHPAEDVLENAYGDCKDKHTLLASLLKAVGIEAWPALVNTARKVDTNIPSPGQFDHMITVVPRGDKMMWLDTTPEVAPVGLLIPIIRGKEALVIPASGPSKLVKVPEVPPFASEQSFTVKSKLNANGTLTAHMDTAARGDLEVVLRTAFRSVPQAQWKDLVQNISRFSGFGGDVSNVTASTPEDTAKAFTYSYDYTRKDYSDWENHRITPPLPPFSLAGTDEIKPVEPYFLGGPGEVVLRATIELPPGQKPQQIPGGIDVTDDFAEYHSSYKMDNGTFTAIRRLVIKRTEVPLSDWKQFLAFRKIIFDDQNQWINFNSTEGANTTTNSEAERYRQEGLAALNRGEVPKARESFQHILKIDPTYPGAHANLAMTYFVQGNEDAGLMELRKEEELHPEDIGTHRAVALILRTTKPDEAMAEFRKILAIDPANREAAINLSQMLTANGKRGEAIEVLEKASTAAPEDSNLKIELGSAYVENGDKEKGLTVLQQCVKSGRDYGTLNDVAYALADKQVDLELASEYSEKALHEVEATSLETASDDQLLAVTRSLGMIWDTVGWVQFRLGNLDRAQSYLRAAWELEQDATIADHLAQLYERQGKRKEAEHMYELGFATSGRDKDVLRKHYEKLTGHKPPDQFGVDFKPPVLKRNPRTKRLSAESRTIRMSPGEELSRARTFTIPAGKQHGMAVFWLDFTAGKLDTVTYKGGEDSLKDMASTIETAGITQLFPTGSTAKVMRQGMLSCTNFSLDSKAAAKIRCDLVLLPVETTQATPPIVHMPLTVRTETTGAGRPPVK